MKLYTAIIKAIFILSVLGLTSCNKAYSNQIYTDDNNDDISAYYGFEEMEIIKLDWGIEDLRIADFNGDGLNDIAAVNNRKAKIELLIQKDTIGPGETEVEVDPDDIDVNVINPPTRFDRQSMPVSQRIYSLVYGDLNSDGLIDLAFYGEPKGLYVILQKAGKVEKGKSTSLSWQTKRKINIEDGLLTSNTLICTDLNNDNADDLALAGRDGIYIIVQKKDGSLSEPTKFATTAMTLGIETGDLNGDNVKDLILITNDKEKMLHVHFGLETGQLGPQIRFFLEKPYGLELHNIDKIVGDEILAIDFISKRLICYNLATENQENNDWPILFYPLASGEGSTKRDLAIGDFNSDGLIDITISDPGAAELIFYKQIKGIGLAEPVRYPAFSDITSLSAADIEGDGKTELAVLSVKEKVIGISRFEDNRLTFPKAINFIGEPLAMELADIDSDKSVDCVYISKDADDIRFLRLLSNISAANKSDESEPALELKNLDTNPDGLKVLDVDQDGLQDVLIFVSYEFPILIRQKQKGEFEIVDSPNAQASLIKEASLHSIAIADVDSKAGKELLLAQQNFARSLVFVDHKSWNIIDQYNTEPEYQVSTVAAFKIDDDSSQTKPAILLLDGQKGKLQILKSGEDKTYRLEKELDVGKWDVTAHLKMLFASLTGSESKSILLFDGAKFALIMPPTSNHLQQNLEQQFSYETKIKDGLYGSLTVGDINSDDRTDIIMVENRRNHIEILALDNNIKPIPAMRFKIFEQKSYQERKNFAKSSVEPRELKIADVTGDDKADLVTIIHDRIIVYPQD